MNVYPAEARRRFTGARVARLATVSAEGKPHVVPVTFAVDGDELYIAIDSKPKRSMDLKRLRNIEDNPNVTLLADEYNDDWSQLWWARADGSARILSAGSEETNEPIRLLQQRYPQYVDDRPRGPVIQVTITNWSGWTFADDATLLA